MNKLTHEILPSLESNIIHVVYLKRDTSHEWISMLIRTRRTTSRDLDEYGRWMIQLLKNNLPFIINS